MLVGKRPSANEAAPVRVSDTHLEDSELIALGVTKAICYAVAAFL